MILWITLLKIEMDSILKFFSLTSYKELQPTPIELDPEDENLENKMFNVVDKAGKTKATKLLVGNNYNDYTEDKKKHYFCIV